MALRHSPFAAASRDCLQLGQGPVSQKEIDYALIVLVFGDPPAGPNRLHTLRCSWLFLARSQIVGH